MAWPALSPHGGFLRGPPSFYFRLLGPGPSGPALGGRGGTSGAWLVCSSSGGGGGCGGGGGGGASGAAAGVSLGSTHEEADWALFAAPFKSFWTLFSSADVSVLPFTHAIRTSSPNAKATCSNLYAFAWNNLLSWIASPLVTFIFSAWLFQTTVFLLKISISA